MDYKSREKEMHKENCNNSIKKRKNYIVDMLKASRLCLVSGSCLQSLLEVKVIAENKQCFSVICKALQYHVQPDRRGYHCPPQAIHRANSKLENVIVSFNYSNPACHMSCRTLDGTWYLVATQQYILASPILYGQTIYSTGPANSPNLYSYCTVQKQWKTLPGVAILGTHVLIGLDRYLYAVSSTIYRLQMMEYTYVWESVGNLLIPVTDVTLTTCGTKIVIFGMDTSSRQFKVQLFDTLTFTCTVYTDQLPDQIKNSKPFHVYNGSYILHSSGEVFKLTPCDKNKVQFENKGKLFDRPLTLCAAVTFKDNLIIAVSNIDPQMTRKWETQIIDGVKTVEVIERQSTFLLNAAIPKSLLLTKET